jgi:hypothetical protein
MQGGGIATRSWSNPFKVREIFAHALPLYFKLLYIYEKEEFSHL